MDVAAGIPYRSKFGLALEFARSSFIIMLAHRVRYVVGVLNYLTYVAVNYYLWQALYASRPGQIVAGRSLAEMETYVSVAWVARSAYFSNADNVLAARINKGEINSDLLRPTSILLQFYGAALGEAVFRAVFMALPVLLIVLCFFNITPPADAVAGICFTYSMILAFHLFFAVNFIAGLCAVYTEKLQGLLWAKFIILQFLSGLMLPLDFFQPYPRLRLVLELLPFKGMAQTPMDFYLGRITGAALGYELLAQTCWTVALILLCDRMWVMVRKRLETMGG